LTIFDFFESSVFWHKFGFFGVSSVFFVRFFFRQFVTTWFELTFLFGAIWKDQIYHVENVIGPFLTLKIIMLIKTLPLSEVFPLLFFLYVNLKSTSSRAQSFIWNNEKTRNFLWLFSSSSTFYCCDIKYPLKMMSTSSFCEKMVKVLSLTAIFLHRETS